jgi:hypothetical protein
VGSRPGKLDSRFRKPERQPRRKGRRPRKRESRPEKSDQLPAKPGRRPGTTESRTRAIQKEETFFRTVHSSSGTSPAFPGRLSTRWRTGPGARQQLPSPFLCLSGSSGRLPRKRRTPAGVAERDDPQKCEQPARSHGRALASRLRRRRREWPCSSWRRQRASCFFCAADGSGTWCDLRGGLWTSQAGFSCSN